MGAVTSRLRFTTFVIKLPIRSPVLLAKQAASVAVLTDNRLVLGVGTSPWPEDYELTGVPWAKRGKRMDEAIDILRGLTSEGFFEYHGEIFDLPPIKMTPVPTAADTDRHRRPPRSRAQAGRARGSDGWMHGGGDPADLPGLLDAAATTAGRVRHRRPSRSRST